MKLFNRNLVKLATQRPPSEPTECIDRLEFDVMFRNLIAIPDDVWGQYAFSRDPLNGKFTNESRKRLASQAYECGCHYADKIIDRFGRIPPQDLAVKIGLVVDVSPKPAGGGHVIFAQFMEPNKITIFNDCVDKANTLLERQNLVPILGRLDLQQILLAHEIFHFLEELNKTSIFTKTKKIQLWSLKSFGYQSGIVCLGEIAGMAFAKHLLDMSYSPYVLDALLIYPYNSRGAYDLYREIMKIAGQQ